MKLYLYAKLETFFEWLAQWAQGRADRFSYCAECGRNRLFSPPCILDLNGVRWVDGQPTKS